MILFVEYQKVPQGKALIVSSPTFWNEFPAVLLTTPDVQTMLPSALSIRQPSNVCVPSRMVAIVPDPSTIAPIPESVPLVQSNAPATCKLPVPPSVALDNVNELLIVEALEIKNVPPDRTNASFVVRLRTA